MLLTAFFRRAVTLAGAAALALGTAIPASGASVPGWRVLQTLGPAGGVWADNLVATGPGSAWATWEACGPCAPREVIQFRLEHWTGKTWTRVPVPSAFTGTAQGTESIGSSSAANLWLFSGTGPSGQTLRRSGSTWRRQALPSWVIRGNLSGSTSIDTPVFGPAAAWVFSLGQDSISSPHHYAARWNGTAWSKVTLPGIPSAVSALSATDIWVLGSTLQSKPKQILMHWDGKRWHTVAIPAVKVPAGATEFVRDLAAAGPGSVWLQRDIEQGTAGARTLYLLHWNGKSWAKVRLGLPASLVDYLAPDGHGGVWMAANGPSPAFQWRFYHDNAGHWSQQAVPAAKGTSVLDVIGLTQIPRTRSLWAAANMSVPTPANDVDGSVLKYGP